MMSWKLNALRLGVGWLTPAGLGDCGCMVGTVTLFYDREMSNVDENQKPPIFFFHAEHTSAWKKKVVASDSHPHLTSREHKSSSRDST